MQVVALDPGVIVARSVKWQTTCTLLHRGDETFVVDSPVFPDELDALPGILGQAGWSLSGLLVTHADWDHVLGRLAFPEAS
ncbi:MAG TPA: MBL fold metallo-hydrolase, partial [Baekduia sp.]|uniref:MBL fold metallo-hydrolase n=1 Tax=Baekduia sp. TaxID=2600305 RepID=UPI002BB646D6